MDVKDEGKEGIFWRHGIMEFVGVSGAFDRYDVSF
jgi:hypothetical protein